MKASNTFVVVLVLALVMSVPLALFVAAAYGFLSGGALALAMMAWFVSLLSWTAVRKYLVKKSPGANAKAPVVLDDNARKFVLRRIQGLRTWVGFLVVGLIVGLPLAIVEAKADGMYRALAIAVGLNLLMMYGSLKEIKRLRKRLELDSSVMSAYRKPPTAD